MEGITVEQRSGIHLVEQVDLHQCGWVVLDLLPKRGAIVGVLFEVGPEPGTIQQFLHCYIFKLHRSPFVSIDIQDFNCIILNFRLLSKQNLDNQDKRYL